MATIKRAYHKHYTSGIWTLPDGQEIYTLDLPWRNNEIGKSCIPEGQYIVDRDHTGRMQYYRLRDEEVAPRSAIEIHPANRLSQLQGCIAPCMRIDGGPRTAEPVGVNSLQACELLLQWYGEDSFVLEVN